MAIRILEIGDETLDRQHDNLLLWFCRLERALFENAGEAIVDELLGQLHRYVEEHFVYEEALMVRLDYPGIVAHQAEHDAFRQRLEQLGEARSAGGEPLGEALLAFLKDWIVDHINRVDAGISLYLDPNFNPSLKRSSRHLS